MAVGNLGSGIRQHALEKRLMMVSMIVLPWKIGRSVMKSMDIHTKDIEELAEVGVIWQEVAWVIYLLYVAVGTIMNESDGVGLHRRPPEVVAE